MNTPENLRQMLTEVWKRHLPEMFERLQALEVAVEAASRGTLEDPVRANAVSAAHKLAGSLGTFGRLEGTETARTLELMLAEPNPDPAELTEKLQALRQLISG